MTMFAPAARRTAKARVAITGPSGAGKTWTALEVATGLADGGMVAVVDTENGSASLYAGDFAFDVAELRPPYTVDKYLTALKAAAEGGYSVVVIDSGTPAWKGQGGVLDTVDAEKAKERSGGGFSAWKTGDKLWRQLLDAIVDSPIHVIVTFRSKTEYVQEREGSRTVIRKVGMAPEARDGIEYEFTLVFDVDHDHRAVVTKSRCKALADAVIERPDAEVGRVLLGWLNEGDDSAPSPAVVHGADEVTQEQLDDIQTLLASLPPDEQAEVQAKVFEGMKVSGWDELSHPQAENVRNRLAKKKAERDLETAAAK